MRYMKWILLGLLLVNVSVAVAETPAEAKLRWGFNSKWNYLPTPNDAVYDDFVSQVKRLSPPLLRYPGGTITHRWNWKTGSMKSHKQKGTTINPIENVAALAQQTGASFVFVVDIVYSSLSDQIEMLKASQLPIKYVELGNEIYSGHYKDEFKSGKEYAERANQWIPALRKEFPGVKLSVSLLGRKPSKRLVSWNKEVLAHLDDVEAYTYHIYVKNDKTVEQRIAEFEAQLVDLTDKELWITEYGIQDERTLTPKQQRAYIQKLDQLRRYVEMRGDIAMCHILTTKTGSATSGNYAAIRMSDASFGIVGNYFKSLKRDAK